jgi:hypothetical protein
LKLAPKSHSNSLKIGSAKIPSRLPSASSTEISSSVGSSPQLRHHCSLSAITGLQ